MKREDISIYIKEEEIPDENALDEIVDHFFILTDNNSKLHQSCEYKLLLVNPGNGFAEDVMTETKTREKALRIYRKLLSNKYTNPYDIKFKAVTLTLVPNDHARISENGKYELILDSFTEEDAESYENFVNEIYDDAKAHLYMTCDLQNCLGIVFQHFSQIGVCPHLHFLVEDTGESFITSLYKMFNPKQSVVLETKLQFSESKLSEDLETYQSHLFISDPFDKTDFDNTKGICLLTVPGEEPFNFDLSNEKDAKQAKEVFEKLCMSKGRPFLQQPKFISGEIRFKDVLSEYQDRDEFVDDYCDDQFLSLSQKFVSYCNEHNCIGALSQHFYQKDEYPHIHYLVKTFDELKPFSEYCGYNNPNS